MAKKPEKKIETTLVERPPVVAVLGHIDHGKTTLLDAIRKTDVAAGESGGITQHIGAYEITHTTKDGKQKRITVIDTPGHEAFSKMRSRGAKVADVAILVVAADEGIKPQTMEAYEHIKDSKATLVVAINKIDKPEAKPERVKQQLAEKSIMLEGWGGAISNQELSAKTGKGIPELLDLILLITEMEELKADPSAHAEGIVIEANKDSKKGIIATVLITNGTLTVGDWIVSGAAWGKVKSMTDSHGTSLSKASFSSPVVITGFDVLPAVGEGFRAVSDKQEATKVTAMYKPVTATTSGISREPSEKSILPLILKTDVAGTREALEKMVGDLVYQKVGVKILKSDTGEVNEGDFALAKSSNALIAAFKVKVPGSIAKLAESFGIRIKTADVIYELVDTIKEELRSLLPPDVTRTDVGTLSVLAVFKSDASRIILGGKAGKGKVKKGVKAEVKRGGAIILTGKISQLQQDKKDVAEVQSGRECGIMLTLLPPVPTGAAIIAGDELVIFEEEMKPQELA